MNKINSILTYQFSKGFLFIFKTDFFYVQIHNNTASIARKW